MASLPRFQRSIEVGSPTGGIRGIDAGSTGAGIAAAGLAGAAQVAGALEQRLDEIQATKESAWITRATGEADIYSSDLSTRKRQEAGEGAVGHVDGVRTDWKSYADGLLASAPSERARDALSQRLASIEVGLVKGEGKFQAQAELQKRQSDFDQGQQAAMFGVRKNPQQIEDYLRRLEGDLDAASKWIPGTAEPEVKAVAFGSMIAEAAQGAIEQEDFVAARMMVEGERYGRFLTADQRTQLLSNIEEGEKRLFVKNESADIAVEMTQAAGSGADFKALTEAVIHQESRGRADAVSPAGAIGVMQLMPATAKDMAARLGVQYRPEMLTDPAYNRMLGEEYLKVQLAKYDGNQVLALAAYNGGPGNVDKWIERFGDPRTGAITNAEFAAKIPFAETRDYVAKISANLGGSLLSPEEILAERLASIDDTAVRERVRRETLAAWAIGDVARKKTEASKKMAREERGARLEIAVSRGEATYEDIEKSFQAGDISASDLVRLTKARDEAAKSSVKASRNIATATAWLETPGEGNVYTKDDRDAVDILWENSDQTTDAGLALIMKKGIAPERMVADLRLKTQNGDPQAFELADNILSQAPQALDRNGGGEISNRVDEYRAYTRLGYSAQDAAQKASRNADERAANKAALPEIDKELRDYDTAKILDSLPEDSSFSDLAIDPARVGRLQSDWQRAYTEARLDGVSKSEAKAVAVERMHKIYGLSSITTSGDEEVMRFPPERYYPQGEDGHDYIKQQLVERIVETSGAEPTSFQIFADLATETDIRAGQPPRYRVMYVDQNGFRQQLPGMWRPDPSQPMQDLSASREEAFRVQAGRAERKRRELRELLDMPEPFL